VTAWFALAVCSAGASCELAAGIHERTVQTKGASSASGAGGATTATTASTGAAGGATTSITFVQDFHYGEAGVNSTATAKVPELEAGDLVVMVWDVNDGVAESKGPPEFAVLGAIPQVKGGSTISSIWYAHTAAAKEPAKDYKFTTMNQDTYYEFRGVVYRGAKQPTSAEVQGFDATPYQPKSVQVYSDGSVVVLGFTRFSDDDGSPLGWTCPAPWINRSDDGGTAFFDAPIKKGPVDAPVCTTQMQSSPKAALAQIVLAPK
jgi:hypothetical protein